MARRCPCGCRTPKTPTLRRGTFSESSYKRAKAISEAVEVPVIASGGVGHPSHMARGIIDGKASAVLAASIFHFGEFSIRESKEIMKQEGVQVRL
ncbi:hypothetical protein EBU58_14785 [bacterium]|nr:hypothetical protein [bacterium]